MLQKYTHTHMPYGIYIYIYIYIYKPEVHKPSDDYVAKVY
jgi:hypothetical protein